MQLRLIAGLCAALLMLPLSAPQPALAQDRSMLITEFYVYPEDASQMSKQRGFEWPEVKGLSALVRVELDGFSGETRVDAFLVVLDENEKVVTKQKGKHFLPAGEHDIVFPDFMSTADYFGEAGFSARIELSMKGSAPAKDELSFTTSGPPIPEMEVLELTLYNPQGGIKDSYFEPGDEFHIEGELEIGENESGRPPRLIIYAVMEEDSFLLDPFYEYQDYNLHWDSIELTHADGLMSFRARGRLPYYFQEPYEYRHPFRVYAIISFGPNAQEYDYASAVLEDSHYGDERSSQIVEDRLINLDRAYNWLIKRMRPAR